MSDDAAQIFACAKAIQFKNIRNGRLFLANCGDVPRKGRPGTPGCNELRGGQMQLTSDIGDGILIYTCDRCGAVVQQQYELPQEEDLQDLADRQGWLNPGITHE